MAKRILIIEDEENIRRMMRLTLEAVGYEVAEAGDGAQGMNAFGDGSNYDLVLLDQRMPGMDGLATLQRIKERNAAARVIMVTAYASIELAVDAMKLGATDFVRKPLTPEILRGAVQAALAKDEAPTTKTPTKSSDEAVAIPAVTLNGFEIVRREMGPSNAANELAFTVKSPSGEEREVKVEISANLVAYVERVTRRQLPAGNSFWTTQAERFLGEYLWNEGRIPPEGRLSLDEIQQAELSVAAAWSGM